MANFSTLKAAIEAAIKTNGQNAITGAILQTTLLSMVNSLGFGYKYAGMASPAINPGTPDNNLFYLTSTPGTYTYFDGIVVNSNELALLKFSGGAWAKDVVLTISGSGGSQITVDSSLSDSSTNPVQNMVITAALNGKAPLSSPELTGNPTAPTQSVDDNSTKIATTAFVKLVSALLQPLLESGTNIKTINGDSLLGPGDITIPGGGGTPSISVINTSNGDLEFQDPNGNVLVRFANGHIQTKNFNSANSPSGGGGTKTNIKILFFGNSLTQDAVSCLPLLLKEIAPDVDFTIYIWYNGGLTLTNQYNTYILDPTANCGIFSVYSSSDSAWTNYSNSKNMNWVIANCDFDILVLQEYGNSGQSDAIITEAFDNITNWFANNYSKSLKVVSMMDAPARSDVSGVTTRIKHYNEVFYRNCVSQGIIPAGFAISLACGDQTLNQLGDGGNLSPDGVHAQEGLPCLLQAYVIAMWLFDQYGIGQSIWGSKTRITQAVYTELNVPGANLGTGVITGTEAENVLAQRYAIEAYKNGRIFEDEALTTNNS